MWTSKALRSFVALTTISLIGAPTATHFANESNSKIVETAQKNSTSWTSLENEKKITINSKEAKLARSFFPVLQEKFSEFNVSKILDKLLALSNTYESKQQITKNVKTDQFVFKNAEIWNKSQIKQMKANIIHELVFWQKIFNAYAILTAVEMIYSPLSLYLSSDQINNFNLNLGSVDYRLATNTNRYIYIDMVHGFYDPEMLSAEQSPAEMSSGVLISLMDQNPCHQVKNIISIDGNDIEGPAVQFYLSLGDSNYKKDDKFIMYYFLKDSPNNKGKIGQVGWNGYWIA